MAGGNITKIIMVSTGAIFQFVENIELREVRYETLGVDMSHQLPPDTPLELFKNAPSSERIFIHAEKFCPMKTFEEIRLR